MGKKMAVSKHCANQSWYYINTIVFIEGNNKLMYTGIQHGVGGWGSGGWILQLGVNKNPK